MDQNADAFKKLNEKQEDMIDYLFYLYAHQNNVDVKYKFKGDKDWKIPKKRE